MKIAARPPARPWSKRKDLLGNGETWVGKGGHLQSGLFRRRRDREGSERSRVGAAIGPGGGRDSGPLDLLDCHRPAGQEAENNVDAMWDAACAISPASDGPRTDAE